MEKIRPRVKQFLGWEPGDVVPVEWGRAVGEQSLDITAALPPKVDGGHTLGPTGPVGDASPWDLLVVQPQIELSLLAEAKPSSPKLIEPGIEPVGASFVRQVREISLPDDALRRAEVTANEVRRAAAELTSDTTLERAAAASTGAQHGRLVAATGRALVAELIATSAERVDADEIPPAVAGDPQAREEFVAAVVDALDAVRRTAASSGTNCSAPGHPVWMAKRAAFMGPFSDFTRDVLWYLAHAEFIRGEIAKATRAAVGNEPLVVLGHSLGRMPLSTCFPIRRP